MMMPDLEETAAQSQDVMMQTSRGQQRSRQVQCCRSRASELEREREREKTEHEDSTQHSADGAPQQLQQPQEKNRNGNAREELTVDFNRSHGKIQSVVTPACMTERESHQNT